VNHPDLRTLQQWFSAEIFEKHRIRPGDYLGLVRESPRFSKARRMRVYSYAAGARLKEALEVDFPCAAALLKDSFGDLCNDYLKVYPSCSFTLDRLGHKLPEFVFNHELQKTHPYLHDLTSFEWFLATSFFVDGIKPANPNFLSSVAPSDLEKVRFELNPSVCFFNSAYDVDKLVKGIVTEKSKTEFTYLIYNDGTAQFLKSSHHKKEFWHLLKQGLDLTQACDEFAKLHPTDDLGPIVMSSLQEWARLGLIQGITTS